MSLDTITVKEFIHQMVQQHNYRKIKGADGIVAHMFYRERLRKDLDPNEPLTTHDGYHISSGFTRIVIGDYGAYIEFSPEQAILMNIKTMPGQEYRLKSPYKDRVKYFWLTDPECQAKIYLQKRTVSYADYRVGMYYISPEEVR